MSPTQNRATLESFVSEFNRGNLDVIDELLTTEFFNYAPYPDEQTAPEAFRQVAEDLRIASPDLLVSITDLRDQDEQIYGQMTISGTHTDTLWGVPGNGKYLTFQSGFVARFAEGKLAIRWEDVNLIGLLREMGIVPQPENAHLKPPHPILIPEIVIRLAFNGLQLQEKPCSHLELIQVTEPSTHVCEQCVASGDEWPALRMCLICGFVGCCDTSVNKHAKKHCEESGHAIIRSIQPGEGWIWCYEDNALLSSRHLRR